MKRLVLLVALGFVLGSISTTYLIRNHAGAFQKQASVEAASQGTSNDDLYAMLFDLAESRPVFQAVFSDDTPDYSAIEEHDRFLADLTAQSRGPMSITDEGWKKLDYGLYVFPGE